MRAVPVFISRASFAAASCELTRASTSAIALGSTCPSILFECGRIDPGFNEIVGEFPRIGDAVLFEPGGEHVLEIALLERIQLLRRGGVFDCVVFESTNRRVLFRSEIVTAESQIRGAQLAKTAIRSFAARVAPAAGLFSSCARPAESLPNAISLSRC